MSENANTQPDEKTFTLRKPIKLADRTITEVTACEPTAGDIEQVGKKAETNPHASGILLVQLSTGLIEGEVRKLGARDFQDMLVFINGFFPEDQKIGETS